MNMTHRRPGQGSNRKMRPSHFPKRRTLNRGHIMGTPPSMSITLRWSGTSSLNALKKKRDLKLQAPWDKRLGLEVVYIYMPLPSLLAKEQLVSCLQVENGRRPGCELDVETDDWSLFCLSIRDFVEMTTSKNTL